MLRGLFGISILLSLKKTQNESNLKVIIINQIKDIYKILL